jgi:hypothetical protein
MRSHPELAVKIPVFLIEPTTPEQNRNPALLKNTLFARNFRPTKVAATQPSPHFKDPPMQIWLYDTSRLPSIAKTLLVILQKSTFFPPRNPKSVQCCFKNNERRSRQTVGTFLWEETTENL